MTRKAKHPGLMGRQIRTMWAIVLRAVKIFFRIDGTLWAGAFAFNMFFALFPMMILLATIASFFIDRERALSVVIAYIKGYVPISGEMQAYIFKTIAGVIKARGPAGAVAFLILIWVSLQCFITLIRATNRAWGFTEYRWWRQPVKSMVLLGIATGAVLLDMMVSVLMRMAKALVYNFHSLAYGVGSFFLPVAAMFFGLSLLYKLAPQRSTRFAEVWAPAVFATVLLRTCDGLFALYLKDFAALNAVYGAFGGIIALLLWINVSGSVIIFGACLCAGQADLHSFGYRRRPRAADYQGRR